MISYPPPPYMAGPLFLMTPPPLCFFFLRGYNLSRPRPTFFAKNAGYAASSDVGRLGEFLVFPLSPTGEGTHHFFCDNDSTISLSFALPDIDRLKLSSRTNLPRWKKFRFSPQIWASVMHFLFS